MFVGTFYHTLESKGRFSLPKTFRGNASNWVLTAGLDGCLFIFPESEFHREAEKLASLSYSQADHRALIRHFASHASLQAPDELGRLTLTPDLRQLAGLGKKLVIIGALTRIEVWGLDQYHQFFDNLATTVTQSSEKINL
jgi:MraZ protein